LAIRARRGCAAAPTPPPAGGCFSIPARISAGDGAPWKPAAPSTRCSAIAKVDERLLLLTVAGLNIHRQPANRRGKTQGTKNAKRVRLPSPALRLDLRSSRPSQVPVGPRSTDYRLPGSGRNLTRLNPLKGLWHILFAPPSTKLGRARGPAEHRLIFADRQLGGHPRRPHGQCRLLRLSSDLASVTMVLRSPVASAEFTIPMTCAVVSG